MCNMLNEQSETSVKCKKRLFIKRNANTNNTKRDQSWSFFSLYSFSWIKSKETVIPVQETYRIWTKHTQKVGQVFLIWCREVSVCVGCVCVSERETDRHFQFNEFCLYFLRYWGLNVSSMNWMHLLSRPVISVCSVFLKRKKMPPVVIQ